MRIRFAFTLLILFVTLGCHSNINETANRDRSIYVEIGQVPAATAHETTQAFSRANVPAYFDGNNYPRYRILVPPEYRQQGLALLDDLHRRAFPYMIVPTTTTAPTR